MEKLKFSSLILSLSLLSLAACQGVENMQGLKTDANSVSSGKKSSKGVSRNAVGNDAIENDSESTEAFNQVADFPYDQISKVELKVTSEAIKSISLYRSGGAKVVIPAAYDLKNVKGVLRGKFAIINFPRVDGSVVSIFVTKGSDGAYRFQSLEGSSLAYVDTTKSVTLKSDGSLLLTAFDNSGSSFEYLAQIDANNQLKLTRQ
jgi:hypothetical protein